MRHLNLVQQVVKCQGKQHDQKQRLMGQKLTLQQNLGSHNFEPEGQGTKLPAVQKQQELEMVRGEMSFMTILNLNQLQTIQDVTSEKQPDNWEEKVGHMRSNQFVTSSTKMAVNLCKQRRVRCREEKGTKDRTQAKQEEQEESHKKKLLKQSLESEKDDYESQARRGCQKSEVLKNTERSGRKQSRAHKMW